MQPNFLDFFLSGMQELRSNKGHPAASTQAFECIHDHLRTRTYQHPNGTAAEVSSDVHAALEEFIEVTQFLHQSFHTAEAVEQVMMEHQAPV